MLWRPKNYLPLLMILMVCLGLSAWRPEDVGWWMGLFVITGALFVLLAIMVNVLWMDRLLISRQYEQLISFCSPTWQHHPSRLLKNLSGIYMANAWIEQGTPMALQQALKLLEQIDPSSLSPRLRNRYWLLEGQLHLYLNRYEEALAALKNCALHPLSASQLTRLFYFFSLSFTLLNQEPERSLNYALKAFELNPKEARYKAQYGLMLLRTQANPKGRALLNEALAAMPTQAHPWEAAMYQAALKP